MSTTRTVLATLAIVTIVAVLSVFGYRGGWWLAADSTNRQTRIDQTNYGTQTALIHELHTKVEQIAEVDVEMTNPAVKADQKDALAAQRKAMVTGACALTENLQRQNMPADLITWVDQNCS